MKILLVEDDLFLRQLYQDVLSTEKYSVDTAVDGNEAFEKMHNGGYALVLLDMYLPKMSGVEVMKKLQSQHPQKPNKKVVFMSNTDSVQDLKQIKELKCDHFLKSDLTPDQLVEKIKQYIA